jgi:hypothetical protein
METFAQPVSLKDTLGYLMKSEPKPAVRLDSRGSFVTGTNVRIAGIKAGISFADRLEFGIGYQWLVSDHRKFYPSDTPNGYALTDLKLRYGSFYSEYTFFAKKYWSVTVPVQLGLGQSFYLEQRKQGNNIRHGRGLVWLYEPAMITDFYFLRYFSVGGGIGYRLMLLNNKSIDERFSAPVYMYRFRVFFGKIYRDLRPQ